MIKRFIVLLLVLILSLSVASPALAKVCRNYEGQEICILSIKRSAKKYWEYRAAVSVDEVKIPVEVYNCRGRFKVKKDGSITQFTQNSPGEMICSFFKK
ncbi:hypothetical protein [Cylindrospermum sp. FACHB-282]|uniref:hypothetical protein n=1 Tax=Cylindrospermum sp. FACHB-282 TaxID=2692794 RepID=UPI0016820784|nr:hypothetical protein [Cylindrospermum sp. FACHB-282]MBD2386099.1 hypothetical protein [Cylindrospermum sp. FACHB-282]